MTGVTLHRGRPAKACAPFGQATAEFVAPPLGKGFDGSQVMQSSLFRGRPIIAAVTVAVVPKQSLMANGKFVMVQSDN
ncbi:hypothetical protein PCC79_13270 [Propioniciclava soli]|uniref:Uncharacterized protein n=1 Tax=Propioniciclava soli TaxID=2775081 RepID=A0ABZ3C6K2_9ACTN